MNDKRVYNLKVGLYRYTLLLITMSNQSRMKKELTKKDSCFLFL